MKIKTPYIAPVPVKANVPQPSSPTDGWLLKPIDRPSFTDSLTYPEDITRLSLKDVSFLFGRYTALYAYVVSECAKVNQEVLRMDSEIFRCKGNITRTGTTYGKNKYHIDAMVRGDKRHEDLQLQRNTLLERKEIVERFMDIYDKYSNSLSREMTRRTSEMHRS